MRVQDVMTKEVAYVDPETNTATAAEIMWNRNCGALPVVENGGRVVGIVTDRDLFIALGTSNRNACDLRVGELIDQQNLSLCIPGDDIRTALATMAERQIRRLPVVDKAGSLKGILSVDDIALRAEADGLSNADVLTTIKAIWSRQIHPKAGVLQASEERRSAA
jgi:CBS domain-containing protein